MTPTFEHKQVWLPFPKKDLMNEVSHAILCHASQVALITSDFELADDLVGIEVGAWNRTDFGPEVLAQIDPSDFWVGRIASHAYDFAYQVGHLGARTDFGDRIWDALCWFYKGAARIAWGGAESPFADECCKLNIVLKAVAARRSLVGRSPIHTAEMGLLIGLDETSMKVLLKNEGVEPNEVGQVAADQAEAILRKHPNFTPTLIAGEPDEDYSSLINEAFRAGPFDESLDGAMDCYGFDRRDLAKAANVDKEWVGGLLGGVRVDCDLEALQRVAVALGADVPLFVGQAVAAILSAAPDDGSNEPASE